MNIEQANQILDRHKEGSRVYSILTVTKALFLTGDIPDEPPALGEDGEDTWGEESCMDESTAIGC
jgi:hypothetical protein